MTIAQWRREAKDLAESKLKPHMDALWAKVDGCDRATCPDHSEHVLWALRIEQEQAEMAHEWALMQGLK